MGDKVKTTFVESVPEGADAERVLAVVSPLMISHGLQVIVSPAARIIA